MGVRSSRDEAAGGKADQPGNDSDGKGGDERAGEGAPPQAASASVRRLASINRIRMEVFREIMGCLLE